MTPFSPHGLVPTLLLYDAYRRLTNYTSPSPSIFARAEAIDKATKEIKNFDQAKFGNVRLFNSRLVQIIKGKGTDSPYEKSRTAIAA